MLTFAACTVVQLFWLHALCFPPPTPKVLVPGSGFLLLATKHQHVRVRIFRVLLKQETVLNIHFSDLSLWNGGASFPPAPSYQKEGDVGLLPDQSYLLGGGLLPVCPYALWDGQGPPLSEQTDTTENIIFNRTTYVECNRNVRKGAVWACAKFQVGCFFPKKIEI